MTSPRAGAVLSFLALVPSPTRAPGARPSPAQERVGTVDCCEALAPFRERLEALVERGTIRSLVVVAILDGAIVWSEGFGLADAERSLPATPETVYPVASVSKGITGLAATLLIHEGRLALDQPASQAVGWELPRAAGVAREPSVADLAAMKGGMPHGGVAWLRDLPDPELASARVVRDFSVIASAPGVGVNYSNYDSGLLERAVARASGGSYVAFVAERILAPLDLRRTAASPLQLPQGSTVATVFWDEKPLIAAPLFTPTAGQGYYSCAADLAALALAHLGVRAAKEAGPTLAVLRESRWPSAPGRLGATDYSWMGWAHVEGAAGVFELSNGQVMSSTSAILLCSARTAAVVCVTNSQWIDRAADERVADWVVVGAMDVLVPGCRKDYVAAAARAEAPDAARVPAPSLESFVGEWSGELRLAGQAQPLRVTLREDRSARLELDGFQARCPGLTFEGPTLGGPFVSAMAFPFLGESAPLSTVWLSLAPGEGASLTGSAVVSRWMAGHGTIGIGPGLVQLTRR